jgi:uncharacterized protein
MTYVASRAGDHLPRVVHDADSHLMEPPEWLVDHADPAIREQLRPLTLGGMATLAAGLIESRRADPIAADRYAGREAALFSEKNWSAFGAFDPDERRVALDHLGFSTQLVFSTFSHRALLKHPLAEPQISFGSDVHYGTVRAHNRGITEFCAGDPRLLPVCWVSLHEPDRALEELDFALEAGAAAIEIPSYAVEPISLTHVDLLPFYARLEEARVPFLFHIGGGGKLVAPPFENNGRTYENRFYDGEPAQPLLIFMGMPQPVEMALAALIFDGVFERFPGLRCGVIENGATWMPTLLERLDLALNAFGRTEEFHGLSMLPSEYVRRHVKAAPFAYENLGALVERTGAELYLFSTDFPHDEGSLDPIAEFQAKAPELTERERELFYRGNFEELMGRAFAPRARAGEPSG